MEIDRCNSDNNNKEIVNAKYCVNYEKLSVICKNARNLVNTITNYLQSTRIERQTLIEGVFQLCMLIKEVNNFICSNENCIKEKSSNFLVKLISNVKYELLIVIDQMCSLNHIQVCLVDVFLTLDVVPILVSWMGDDSNISVQEATLKIIRSFSLVSNGREKLVEAKVIKKMVQLISSSFHEVSCCALRATFNLSVMNVEIRQEIVQAGALPLLLIAAKDNSKIARQSAAIGTLANLATETDIKRSIVQDYNGLIPLLNLLNSTDESILTHACRALFAIAANDENKLAIAEAGGLIKLLECITYPSESVRMNATGALANLAIHTENKLSIVQYGALSKLYSLSYSNNPKIKRQVARCFFALAALNKNRASMIEEGCLKALVHLLHSDSNDVQLNAAGAIGNVAMTDSFKTKVVESGALDRLVALANIPEDPVQRQAARAIFTLTAKDVAKIKLAKINGIPVLIQLTKTDNEDIQRDATGALANMAIGTTHKSEIVRLGGLKPILKLLQSENCVVQRQAARGIFALAGTEENQQKIIDENGLEPLIKLLNSKNEEVQKHACGAIANISNHFPAKVIQGDTLRRLIKLVLEHSNLDVRRQATRAIFNLHPQGKHHRTHLLLTPYAGQSGEAQRLRHDMRALFQLTSNYNLNGRCYTLPKQRKQEFDNNKQQIKQNCNDKNYYKKSKENGFDHDLHLILPLSKNMKNKFISNKVQTTKNLSNSNDKSKTYKTGRMLPSKISTIGGKRYSSTLSVNVEPRSYDMKTNHTKQFQKINNISSTDITRCKSLPSNKKRKENNENSAMPSEISSLSNYFVNINDDNEELVYMNFFCHSSILLARWPQLENLINQTMNMEKNNEKSLIYNENGDLEIRIPDDLAHHPIVWCAFLEYLYTDAIRIHALPLKQDVHLANELAEFSLSENMPRLMCYCLEINHSLDSFNESVLDSHNLGLRRNFANEYRESTWTKDFSKLLSQNVTIRSKSRQCYDDEDKFQKFPFISNDVEIICCDIDNEVKIKNAKKRKNDSSCSSSFSRNQNRYKAHKLILSSRCNYFKALFGDGSTWSDSKTSKVKFYGDEKALQIMLRYLYCGIDNTVHEMLYNDPSMTLQMLVIANEYNLDGLQMHCEKFLIEFLNPTNVFVILEELEFVYAPLLRCMCIDYILKQQNHIEQVLSLRNISEKLLNELNETAEIWGYNQWNSNILNFKREVCKQKLKRHIRSNSDLSIPQVSGYDSTSNPSADALPCFQTNIEQTDIQFVERNNKRVKVDHTENLQLKQQIPTNF